MSKWTFVGYVKQGLRGQQELDQARKTLDHSLEDLKAARDKQTYFAQRPYVIKAPRPGTIIAVHASPGQYVAAAAPLVTVIDLDPIWIRVPVPESDLLNVDVAASVMIEMKNTMDTAQRFARARPVAQVPQVDPIKHTADLFYQLEPSPPELAGVMTTVTAGFSPSPLVSIAGGVQLRASEGRAGLAKDQMVSVHVPVGQRRSEWVVPHGALVFDAQGGTWIYLERTQEGDQQHRFERRRVELGASVPEGVVVRARFAASDRVVVSGGAVLFSREFHSVPLPLGEGDD